MGPAEIAMVIGAAVVIGSLIGSVGIGGVLLVPWLTVVMGLGVRDAVAIAMASYLATGIVAVLQARFTEDWTEVRGFWPLVLTTLPGAFLGGLAIAAIPDRLALLVLALFLVASGGWTLVSNNLHAAHAGEHRKRGWITGLVSGFASALTGTGGPAVLIPILMWQRVPLMSAIALGQIVQLPIAFAATSGNLAGGLFDLGAAAIIGAALVPGVLIGRWAAKRLPLVVLARVVALMMIAIGVMLVLRVIQ